MGLVETPKFSWIIEVNLDSYWKSIDVMIIGAENETTGLSSNSRQGYLRLVHIQLLLPTVIYNRVVIC